MRLLRLTVVLAGLGIAAAPDADRDGLDDALELQLLQQFAPTFHVSAAECDGLPAEFSLGRHPGPVARNGTIYGQAFPSREGHVELHYYHLWARDCGMAGHALDAEYVSALVRDGKARYWHAAAHQDTVCDSANAAPAASINAIDRGPHVWISAGKHASYLRREACGGGCGGDRCASSSPISIARILNLGERVAPMNGAEWIASPEWNLAAKMSTDFDDLLIARLDQTNDVVTIASRVTPWPVVRGGAEAGHHTGSAIRRANSATRNWLRNRLATSSPATKR